MYGAPGKKGVGTFRRTDGELVSKLFLDGCIKCETFPPPPAITLVVLLLDDPRRYLYYDRGCYRAFCAPPSPLPLPPPARAACGVAWAACHLGRRDGHCCCCHHCNYYRCCCCHLVVCGRAFCLSGQGCCRHCLRHCHRHCHCHSRAAPSERWWCCPLRHPVAARSCRQRWPAMAACSPAPAAPNPQWCLPQRVAPFCGVPPL